MNDEWRDDVSKRIRFEVEAGFTTHDEDIVASTVDLLMEEGIDRTELRSAAVRALVEARKAHGIAERNYPATTDFDRLTRAFDDLEDRGVVARHDFTCCQTCGRAEIEDEMDAVRTTGKTVRGYAFYHTQDTERAIDGDGLMLSYGSIEDDDEESVRVGEMIVGALKRVGLAPEWDGDLNSRIIVAMDWKRRTAS